MSWRGRCAYGWRRRRRRRHNLFDEEKETELEKKGAIS